MYPDFDEAIAKFRNKEFSVSDWNFCICNENDGTFSAYIMGEGAEQCLTKKAGFTTREEIVKLYTSLGVQYISPI